MLRVALAHVLQVNAHVTQVITLLGWSRRATQADPDWNALQSTSSSAPTGRAPIMCLQQEAGKPQLSLHG